MQKSEAMLGITDRQPGEWTRDDLQQLPDDGNRYEIIEGVLYVSPSPRRAHQGTAGALFAILWTWLETRGLGRIYSAPFDVIFSHKNVVEPDVVFVSRERIAILGDWIEGVPDLTVEVLSSDPRLDRVKKLNLYARWGVPHYWILDPVAHVLEAFELHDGHYRIAWTGQDSDLFLPALFPGLEIPLARIWDQPPQP